MPSTLQARVARTAGSADLALGISLAVTPSRLLRAVGVHTTAESTFLRVLGAQTAVVGTACLIVADDPRLPRSLTAAVGAGRLASGVALVSTAGQLGGRRWLLRVLGAAELLLGLFHLVQAAGSEDA